MGRGYPVKGRDTYQWWWLSCKDEDTCRWPTQLGVAPRGGATGLLSYHRHKGNVVIGKSRQTERLAG